MAHVIDIPESMRFDTIASPGYHLIPSEFRNFELLPAELAEILKRRQSAAFADRRVDCSVIPDAVVDGPGFVYDPALSLFRQTIHQASQGEIDGYTWGVGEAARQNTIPYVPGVTLLCEKSGIGNYGHWLVEMLPIVFCMLPQILRWGWKVRLPVADAAMNAVMHESIQALGVPTGQVAPRQAGPQRYERLVVVSNLTRHGEFYSPLVIAAAAALAASVETVSEPARVWVSRSMETRRFVNEDAIIELLASRGWRIVDPRHLTLSEQIATFKNALQIAGVAGAGLTNLVFAPRDILVTAFMPSKMPDIFYWTLASHKKQRFRDVRCQEVEVAGHAGNWGAPVTLDMDLLLTALAP